MTTNKKQKYILNTLLLSLVNIVMRAVSVSFGAFVSRKVGEETLGLITLVGSVYAFAVTVALSGVNLAAVRLVSRRLALCERASLDAKTTRAHLRREMVGCILYSLLFGTAASLGLLALSKPIGLQLLQDARTVVALKISAAALPAISLSSALAGYFTGLRKITKNAIIALWEQFVKITITSAALMLIAPKSTEYALISVIGGAAIAEGGSLLLSLILYFTDKVKAAGKNKSPDAPKNSFGRGAKVALPIALGSYVRQGLVCAEHIAIPRGLKIYSGGAAGALASYGVLHGMAFPIIFFPASIISSAASLLIPELSEYSALADKGGVRKIGNKTILLSLVFSSAVAAFLTLYGREVGISVYNNAAAGKYITALAPLITVMYLDTAVDSVLKGIGCEVFCMRVNIIDAFCSLILVLTVVPRFGIWGYIACVYITEILNFVLSITKMTKETMSSVKIKKLCFIPASAYLTAGALRLLFTIFPCNNIWVKMTIFLLIYSLIMLINFKEKSANVVQKGERQKKPCKHEKFGIQ